MLRKINLSAAVIVLICFFLPWVQLSCGGAKDTLSGWDLARNEQATLWLVPVLMLAIIAFALLRGGKKQPKASAILGAICGGIATLLMNRERVRVNDHLALISAQLTAWFWLSLMSAVAMVICSVGLLFRKRTEN